MASADFGYSYQPTFDRKDPQRAVLPSLGSFSEEGGGRINNLMGGNAGSPATPAQGNAGAGGGTAPANGGVFDYTGGSLLTPWTTPFQYNPAAPAQPAGGGGGEDSGGGGGGAPAPPPPQFSYGDLSYSFRNPGDYAAGQAFAAPQSGFQGSRMANAPGFTGPADYQAQQYTPLSGFVGGTLNAPDQRFQPTAGMQLDRFQAPDAFQAPTVTDDPGYQFRLQQGIQALENSKAAQGTLRGGAALKALNDYAGQSASQEYGAAYGRRFGEYQDRNATNMAAYDRNVAAQQTENETAYGRAFNEYTSQEQADLARFQANEQSRYNAANLTENSRQFGADLGFRSGFAANESAYNRRSQEYQLGQQLDRQANETNYARDASEYDREFGNAKDVYALNETNRLNAYQATAASNAAMGNLGWNVASGTWDRNYQKDLTSFQMAEQQRQQAAANAAMAAGGGGGGGAPSGPSEAQQYARALGEYQMNYDMFRTNQSDQYSRLMGLAGLGSGAASNAGQFAGQNAAAMGNNYVGAGNAAAAAAAASGNAWAGAAQNAGQIAAQGAGYLAQPQYTDIGRGMY